MFRVEFAPEGDCSPYYATFTNEQAVERFLKHIENDEVWRNVPYTIFNDNDNDN